ncbi:hypothetical protein V8G54_010391, partial [Vigna mungo]
VCLLKKFHGTPVEQYLPLLLTTSEFGPTLQPEKILDSRVIVRGAEQIPQVLVQWESTKPELATWEDALLLQQSYPSLTLEDKGVLKGKGLVTRELHDRSERRVVMNEGQVERDQGHMELDQQEVESRHNTRIRKENSLLKGFVR